MTQDSILFSSQMMLKKKVGLWLSHGTWNFRVDCRAHTRNKAPGQAFTATNQNQGDRNDLNITFEIEKKKSFWFLSEIPKYQLFRSAEPTGFQKQ